MTGLMACPFCYSASEFKKSMFECAVYREDYFKHLIRIHDMSVADATEVIG